MAAIRNLLSILRIILPLLISFCIFAVSDEDLATLVQNALHANEITAQSKVQVEVVDGVVNLTGNVATNEQAIDVIKLAVSFPGVTDVDIRALTINHDPVGSDDYIIAKVKDAFIREKLFGAVSVKVSTIQVSARNGIVSLSGIADSQVEIDKAVEIAREVIGVHEVHSMIALE